MKKLIFTLSFLAMILGAQVVLAYESGFMQNTQHPGSEITPDMESADCSVFNDGTTTC